MLLLIMMPCHRKGETPNEENDHNCKLLQQSHYKPNSLISGIHIKARVLTEARKQGVYDANENQRCAESNSDYERLLFFCRCIRGLKHMPRDKAKQQAEAAPRNGKDDNAGFCSVVDVIWVL